jgi:hypothetical protein
MGAAVVGKSAKLYYNSATNATPTWVEIKDAMDINMPMSKDKADVSTRRSGWRLHAAGLKDVGIEFDYLHNLGADTVFDALLAMYTGDTAKEFAALDGAVASSGTQGLRFFGLVFDMSVSQALAEGTKYAISVAPVRTEESSALVEPSWMDVT